MIPLFRSQDDYIAPDIRDAFFTFFFNKNIGIFLKKTCCGTY